MSGVPDQAFAAWNAAQLARTEAALSRWVGPGAPEDLGQAMRYAVQGGGKRLRPLLVLAAREAVADEAVADEGALPGNAAMRAALDDAALRAACAVELIHAYSLVHDDMPCMDNDVLRRGKPTVHVQFGEAGALLAGDALQALAFELLTPEHSAIPANVQATLCRQLARAAGAAGMAGGQAIDLDSVGLALTQEQLEFMHLRKTGALIRAAVLLGAWCSDKHTHADADNSALFATPVFTALDHYAKHIGLAFQVIDDILDSEADTATLGKTSGKDKEANKPTYVTILGVTRARAMAAELHANAVKPLAGLDNAGLNNSTRLLQIADYIMHRAY